MASIPRTRFKNFIDSSPEDPTRLPLLHTTSAYDFTDIAGGDVIAPTHCKVFDEDLTYLFYGRPAYRTQAAMGMNLKYHWPFCFIIDPDRIDKIKAIYPFDTGAFALKLYDGFFHSRQSLADFRLPGDLSYARKVAGRFYANSKEYINGSTSKREDLPNTEFEAHGIQSLSLYPAQAKMNPNSLERDERTTSIEVQISEPIDIVSAVIALIIPEPWIIEPIFQQACDRWVFSEKIYTYELIAAQHHDRWVGSLYNKVTEIYAKLGIVR